MFGCIVSSNLTKDQNNLIKQSLPNSGFRVPEKTPLLKRSMPCGNFFFFLVAPTLGSLLSLLEHRAELVENRVG
jgi:hypothetical protein